MKKTFFYILFFRNRKFEIFKIFEKTQNFVENPEISKSNVNYSYEIPKFPKFSEIRKNLEMLKKKSRLYSYLRDSVAPKFLYSESLAKM